MNVFVARQPVFDREQNVVAYELLYRASQQNSAQGMPEPSQATKEVLSTVFTVIGLKKISEGLPVLLNVTEAILANSDLPRGLPDVLIPEVLEDVSVNQDVIQEVKNLHELGYKVALDDFVYQPQWLPLLPYVRYIKLDVMALKMNGIREQLAKLKATGQVKGKLLAEKVETHEEFALCRELGFDYFQGYFLAKPQVMEGRRIPTSQLVINALLNELVKEDYRVAEVERIISMEPRLSYRLLRIVNSAFVGLTRKVTAISDAVVILGAAELRRWAAVLVLSEIENKPNALIVTAVVRARMCELVAKAAGQVNLETHFITGLFSMLDALLDQPLELLVEQMPLAEEINVALIKHEGYLGQVLDAVTCYEAGQFDKILQADLDVDADLLDIYQECLEWAQLVNVQL